MEQHLSKKRGARWLNLLKKPLEATYLVSSLLHMVLILYPTC